MGLDWTYILGNLSPKWIAYFVLYFLWSKIEKASFGLVYRLKPPSADKIIAEEEEWGTDPNK
jgi:hypothetical protein